MIDIYFYVDDLLWGGLHSIYILGQPLNIIIVVLEDFVLETWLETSRKTGKRGIRGLALEGLRKITNFKYNMEMK